MKDYGCPFYNGDKVKCEIDGTQIIGEICYSDSYIYIIHNEDRKHGNRPANEEDRKGYKYGWEILNSNSADTDTWTKGLSWNSVNKIELLYTTKPEVIRIETDEEESTTEVEFKCRKKRKLNIETNE